MEEYNKKDAHLAQLAQNGNIDAEETLMRKYKPLVRNKASFYFMVGADEEDVIQEGMIGLLKAVQQYRPDKNASFSTFAGLCVTRQIISAMRSADRKKHSILNSSLSLNNPLGEDGEDMVLEDIVVSNDVIGPEETCILNDMLDTLTSNEDGLLSEFELHVLRGLINGEDYATIGAAVGKSDKSVDNAVRRVKEKIRAYLYG